MPVLAAQSKAAIAVRTDLCAIFVSLELSRSTWLITSLSPGGGEKMSKYSVSAGDIEGLFRRFGDLQERARVRTGQSFAVVTIQEAGLDGFWIHRLLEREGIESWVVDPASILTSRRRRRAKTDRIDGETLVRTLLAPLRRVEVLEVIVELCDTGERGADLLDATERGLRFSFAVLNEAVDHAGERLDEFRSGNFEGFHSRRIRCNGGHARRPHGHHERRDGIARCSASSSVTRRSAWSARSRSRSARARSSSARRFAASSCSDSGRITSRTASLIAERISGG